MDVKGRDISVSFLCFRTESVSLKNIDIDIDPEITAENGMAYPNMKVVNFGFSVDF